MRSVLKSGAADRTSTPSAASAAARFDCAPASTARVEIAAAAVHRDPQRAEAAHAELPEALGIEIVEIDVLDRLDPRGLERGRAADDREIDAAELAERGEPIPRRARPCR